MTHAELPAHRVQAAAAAALAAGLPTEADAPFLGPLDRERVRYLEKLAAMVVAHAHPSIELMTISLDDFMLIGDHYTMDPPGTDEEAGDEAEMQPS